ncbi:MAG TPA: glycosyltransferase family 4 protein [Thermoanaerobaculia bacterium]|nr:glycosyltransferase family 4 protein [Thermoanaerobaculia bacterium]
MLLVVNTLPPRDVSGVGEQVLQLAAGLRQEGAEVQILGRGPGGVAGPKVLFPLFAVPAVWLALRRFRPHVVQVHESDGGLAALLIAWLAPSCNPRPRLVALLQVSYREERRAVRPLRCGDRVLGLPSAVELRFRRYKAPLQIALGWLTAWAADRVLAPSAATAAELRRDYGVRTVAVVPNAMGETAPDAGEGPDVPAARYREEPAGNEGDVPAHRKEPAGDSGGNTLAGGGAAAGYLLVVGRLRIRKGVDVLLAAMTELRRRHPAARLLIAGDGEHRASLERAAASLGLGEAVSFLGSAGAARVRRLLRGAAALVVPSIYEGMPLVVLEAMEAAVPVVASRVSGIPEVVEDGRTGWLVQPEDPARLAAALAAALDDPAEARRRGAAGRERLRQCFRPVHAARRWRQEVLGVAGSDD